MTENQIPPVDNEPTAPVRTPRPARQAPPIKPARQAKGDRTTIALLFVAALVAVGGIGFAVGHVTANSATPTNALANRGGGGFGRGAFGSLAPGQTFDASQFGGGAGFGRGAVGGSVTGTVQSINGTTMTVMLSTGTTVTIDLATGTTYHNETAGSSSDVKTGSTVLVEIDTTAVGSPAPNASGGRTLTAKDVLITTP
jgi:hypothetical protein